MDNNTKLEIAVEIIAAKIAKVSRDNNENKEQELSKLLEEKTKMYQFDEKVINKIINVYGNEVKKEH